MQQDELLQNKYERLCVEYNKLRNKHKDLKDTLASHLDSIKKLQTSLDEKDELIKQLENDCKTLRLENARIVNKLETKNAEDGAKVQVNSEACGVVQQKTQSDATAASNKPPCKEFGQVTEGLDQLLSGFTKELNQWSEAIRSGQNPPESKDVKNRLIERISLLERQLCDVSLQYQMERRRRLMMDKERSSTALNELSASNGDAQGITHVEEPSASESLMLDWMQERVYAITDQAQYFAARAAFLQDELLLLVPHVTRLAEQALYYRSENESSQTALQQLKSELDAAHLNTLRQSTQMAEHIANLTDELQAARAHKLLSPGSTNQTVSDGNEVSRQASVFSNKKGSLFNVLKR